MAKKITVVVAGVLSLMIMTAAAHAAPAFVAMARNLRGALYMGYGPSPYHASEMALAKCTQDSFFPLKCRVVNVRMEVPPPPPPWAMMPPPGYKGSTKKYRSGTRNSRSSPSKYKTTTRKYQGSRNKSKSGRKRDKTDSSKHASSSSEYESGSTKPGTGDVKFRSSAERSSSRQYKWGRTSN